MRCLGDPLPRPVVRENPSGRPSRGPGGFALLGDTASLPFQPPGPHVRRSWLQAALPGGARVRGVCGVRGVRGGGGCLEGCVMLCLLWVPTLGTLPVPSGSRAPPRGPGSAFRGIFPGPAPTLSWRQFPALQKDRKSTEGVTPRPLRGSTPACARPTCEGSRAGHCHLHSAAWTLGAAWEEGFAKAA